MATHTDNSNGEWVLRETGQVNRLSSSNDKNESEHYYECRDHYLLPFSYDWCQGCRRERAAYARGQKKDAMKEICHAIDTEKDPETLKKLIEKIVDSL